MSWPSQESTGWPGTVRPTADLSWSTGRRADRDSEDFRTAVVEINRALDDQIASADPSEARPLIAAAVRTWFEEDTGSLTLKPGLQPALVNAVYDERFGMGPLQPLLDDPEIENIVANGCDQVFISYADGHKEQGQPIAESDDALVELIRRWGAYQGQTARDFSPAKPRLRLALPDGSRLTALMTVTSRPSLSIRRHRLLEADLDQLVGLGTLDQGLREFLRAAVKAHKDIIVTGGMGSGKTTFVRAVAADIPSGERIVTVENEYELHLDRFPERHPDIVAFEARQANAEGEGAITVHDLIGDALRMHARRIIVGEVLGDELIPMLQAMNTGGDGSLCTLHADSADQVFNRMLILGLSFPPATLYQLIGMAVDFVVHLGHEVTLESGEPVNRRYVSEVAEVLPPSDTEQPAINHVYVPGPYGNAVPQTLPQCTDDLAAAGYDPAWFTPRLGAPR